MGMGKAGKRGQAAIFDGITFLLLASLSASMVFFFLSTYGNSQERTLGNAHVLNFMLAAFKAVYSVEASSLGGVALPEDSGGSHTCSVLSDWRGVSVSDVLKKDLRDGKLDDLYGIAPSPGLTALRCGSASVFKEFTDAGYSYFVEVDKIEAGGPVLLAPSGGHLNNSDLSATSDQRITSCSQALPADPFVVATPFRVFKCSGSGQSGSCQSDDYELRGCLWQTQRLS